MTLSFPLLSRSRSVVLAAFGLAKAVAIRDAVDVEDTKTPVAHLLRSAPSVTLLLDEPAASLLRERRMTAQP
jgi:6-phosphogluconolactonase/glucosamine-6-phosphate isomerase/deaminase